MVRRGRRNANSEIADNALQDKEIKRKSKAGFVRKLQNRLLIFGRVKVNFIYQLKLKNYD